MQAWLQAPGDGYQEKEAQEEAVSDEKRSLPDRIEALCLCRLSDCGECCVASDAETCACHISGWSQGNDKHAGAGVPCLDNHHAIAREVGEFQTKAHAWNGCCTDKVVHPRCAALREGR